MGFWFEKGSRARRVLVGLTVLIIVVGVARIGAQFIVHQVLGISTYNYSEYFRKDDRLRLLTWTKYYSPHPYFGYETAAIRQFERDREHRSADDYVIAVIGGSVAEMFGSYIEEHLELLKPLMAALPEARGKHLVFANLALGGSHQPQQYFVASFFLNNVDLFIDIDGFNEAMIISVLPLYPLEYPSVLRTTYERIPAGRIYRRMAASVISLYQFLNWVPLMVPVLARSPIYFLFWNAASRGLNATVQSLQQKYYDAQVEPGPRLPPDEILERKVRLWRSYSELEYALISRIARKRSYV